MLQARRLGKELVVGIHTDEDILSNKGPTVMNLKERYDSFILRLWHSAKACYPELQQWTPAVGLPNLCLVPHMSPPYRGSLIMAASTLSMGMTSPLMRTVKIAIGM